MKVRIFEEMIGKTIVSINGGEGDEEMIFISNDGHKFEFYHNFSCCEQVYISDICGDINDLLGQPLVEAEEVEDYIGPDMDHETYTWTFYKFRTMKGAVTIRWLGTSNGYYSETVSYKPS